MGYVITNENYVRNVYTVKMQSQEVKIDEYIGMKNRISMSVTKISLSTGESATITLKWLTFDIEAGDWVDDPTNQDDFQVDIAGAEATFSVANGGFTFSSDVAGEYTIQTKNVGVDNAKVVIQVA